MIGKAGLSLMEVHHERPEFSSYRGIAARQPVVLSHLCLRAQDHDGVHAAPQATRPHVYAVHHTDGALGGAGDHRPRSLRAALSRFRDALAGTEEARKHGICDTRTKERGRACCYRSYHGGRAGSRAEARTCPRGSCMPDQPQESGHHPERSRAHEKRALSHHRCFERMKEKHHAIRF